MAIFNSVYDAIIIHDAAGKIVDVNDRMLQMYGVTRDESKNRSITSDLSSPDNPIADLPATWEKAMAGRPAFRMERPQAIRWLRIRRRGILSARSC
jgi:PAS domain S-box-containing protein